MEKYIMNYWDSLKTLQEDDTNEEIKWQVTYFLPNLDSEYDDAFTNEDRQVILEAPSIEIISKIAEQYIRKVAKEDSNWDGAEIVNIRKYSSV